MQRKSNLKLRLILVVILCVGLSCSKTDQTSESPKAISTTEDTSNQTPQEDANIVTGAHSSAEVLPQSIDTIPEQSIIVSPKGGLFNKAIEVSLSKEADGDIFYTIDDTDPLKSETAQKVDGPIEISAYEGEERTIHLRYVFKDEANGIEGMIQEETYELDFKAPQAPTTDLSTEEVLKGAQSVS